MIALKVIRENMEKVRAVMKTRGANIDLDQIIELDHNRRNLLVTVESARANRREAGKQIGQTKSDEERQRLIEAQRNDAGELDQLEKNLREIETELDQRLLEIPNLTHPDLPEGGEEDALIVLDGDGSTNTERKFSPKLRLDEYEEPHSQAGKPHWEIAEEHGYIDFERGSKVSGSPFYMLRGDGARLQRALINWMLDLHLRQGYEEIYPPFLVREEPLIGTGQLPKFADTLFEIKDSDLWLVPTAEVPVTNMYREEIFEIEELPVKHSAYTACFRHEQFSAGRQVRGIKRGYQFDKVEMVIFTTEDQSWETLDTLLENALDVVRQLGLKYRVLQLATKDTGFSSAMTYDIEVWSAGSGEWLEVSSVSNFTDFQARRAGLRYRTADNVIKHAHTLNGSGLGIPRTFAALLEQNSNDSGNMLVPEVLRPYLGGQEFLEPPLKVER